MKKFTVFLLIALVWLAAAPTRLFAQGKAFTYQGQLTSGVAVANGSYDIAFALFTTNTGGVALTAPVTNAAVAVNNGLFTTLVNFGNVFTGTNNWLELSVSTNGANNFIKLAPRQPLTPVPYAIIAANVSGTVNASQLSGSIPATSLSGTVPLARLPAAVATNGESGVNFTGTFGGSGGGLTNVPISALTVATATNIVGWGLNTSGQTNIPAGLTNVTAVAVGSVHSLALKGDGTIVSWGGNGSGQTNIPAGLTNATAIAAGSSHSLALKSDSTVIGWGDNTYGQTNMPVGLTNVTALACGFAHNLALRSNGTVVAWGDNNLGQTNVPGGLTNAIAVAAGYNHSLVLKNDGTVVAWGINGNGQINIPAGLTNVVAIAAGGYFSLALIGNGTVVAWGANGYNQSSVPPGLSNVTAIAAGLQHSLALKSDGTVVAWGDNSFGQTTLPAGLIGVKALASGSSSYSALVIRKIAGAIAQGFLGATNSYTPTIGGSASNFSTTTQSGFYAKVGNLVYFEAWVIWNNKNAATASALELSLPPVPVVSPRAVFNIGSVNGVTNSSQIIAIGGAGSSFISLDSLSTNGGPAAGISVDSCAGSGEIQVTGTYRWQ